MIPGCGRQSFLVVFDFDHTVVDCNTDEVIPNALGRSELQKAMIRENRILNSNYGHGDATAVKAVAGEGSAAPAPSTKDATSPRIQWTRLIDTLIAPFSRAELTEAARQTVHTAPGMSEVFDYLLQTQEANAFYASPPTAEEGTCTDARRLVVPNYLEIHIASDSNLLFIQAALDAALPGVRERIGQIHSNPYYDLEDTAPARAGEFGGCPPLTAEERADEAARDAKYNPDMARRRSRLLWYERGGNRCDYCAVKGSKPNMCKSKIIQRLLSTSRLIDPTIIFVGDGGNDYCPVLNVLRPRDFVFARRGFPLHKLLSTGAGGEHGPGQGERRGGCCAVGLWQDPTELRGLFKAVMEDLPFQRLPTLACFYDMPQRREFRAVTLRVRMVDILHRLIADNADGLTASGRAALTALAKSIEEDGPVPALPGQSVVDAWLRNYAFVRECGETEVSEDDPRADPHNRVYLIDGDVTPEAGERRDRTTADASNAHVAPRWGQLPWLHGEIYFYHLVWQFTMLKDAGVTGPAKREALTAHANGDAEVCVVPNVISPYTTVNPLFSQDSAGLGETQGMISEHDPAIPCQNLDRTHLVCEPTSVALGVVARTIQFTRTQDGTSRGVESVLVPYEALTGPVGNSLLVAPAGAGRPEGAAAIERFYRPYHDIFAAEKRDVLVSFIKARVAPMLATRPWAAPRAFIGTLLRWMLWGNGLDLSMFTMEQLKQDGDAAQAAKASAAVDLAAATAREGAVEDAKAPAKARRMSKKLAALVALRREEAAASEAQDGNIVGNELEGLARYLRRLVQAPAKSSRRVTLQQLRPSQFCIDVVMDNVGVECMADLCLGLWFLHHAERRVAALRAAMEAEQEGTASASPSAAELLAALDRVQPTVMFHVKPQPYYKSDVTPRDMEATLAQLEEAYTVRGAAGAHGDANGRGKAREPEAEAAREGRRMLRGILAPFIRKVRAAFATGAFKMDADTVWTEPSEYRDLPPRLVNRYFYTQTCAAPAAPAGSCASGNLSSALTSRRAVYMANKTAVEPKTALVLFKGDLNYRRVVGDRYWERSDFLTTLATDAGATYDAVQQRAVAEVLRDTPAENVVDAPSFTEVVSAYWPTATIPVASIRTIKSEGCVGVSGETKLALDAAQGRGWRTSGKYGVILFAH